MYENKLLLRIFNPFSRSSSSSIAPGTTIWLTASLSTSSPGPKMHRLYTSPFLTLSTLLAFVSGFPTPPTSPAITLLQAFRSDLHCGMIACPGGGPEGHAFCENIGCDYCVVVASTPPTTHYECDGLRRATGEAAMVWGGRWNGSVTATG